MPRLKIERTKFSGAWVVNAGASDPRTLIVAANGPLADAFILAALDALGATRLESDVIDRLERRLARGAAVELAPRKGVRTWPTSPLCGNLEERGAAMADSAFVLAFQEPISEPEPGVLATPEGVARLSSTVAASRSMVDLARSTSRPLIMIGLDTALADMQNFIADLAEFCGLGEASEDVDLQSLSALGSAE